MPTLQTGETHLVKFKGFWSTLPLNQKLVFFVVVFVVVFLNRCIFSIPIYTRLVHSFTCAGILPTQYLKFSRFAGMGHVGYKYMEKGFFFILFAVCVGIIHIYQ